MTRHGHGGKHKPNTKRAQKRKVVKRRRHATTVVSGTVEGAAPMFAKPKPTQGDPQ